MENGEVSRLKDRERQKRKTDNCIKNEWFHFGANVFLYQQGTIKDVSPVMADNAHLA